MESIVKNRYKCAMKLLKKLKVVRYFQSMIKLKR